MNHPQFIIIHCTDVSYRKLPNQLSSVNQYHQGLGYPLSRAGYYVGYHSLITGGQNYRTKLDSEVGAHTIGKNQTSLGVCIGFDGDIEFPQPEDYALLKAQIIAWQDMYLIPNENVVFHRQFNPTKTCPGSLLGPGLLAELLRREIIAKPEEQVEKQKEILLQKVSLLQRLIKLYQQLKQFS